MKVYTKTGDDGKTSLMGGKRIAKNSLRIKAYGDVDELNSLLGIILSYDLDKKNLGKIMRIQKELFVLGTDLATPNEVRFKVPRITPSYIKRLEKEIDQMTKGLSSLKNFVLPGGGKIGSNLHLARAVSRRAERSIVELSGDEKINKNALVYINRLSDWLFTMARYINKVEGKKETVWLGRRDKVN